MLAKHATLSDSAPALPRTAQWAQLVPYRCTHYSSFLRQSAAHQTQLCWWCSPFLLVQRHISQENLPLTQIPLPSPTGPWSMTRSLCLEMKLHQPGRRAGAQARVSREKSFRHTELSVSLQFCSQSVLMEIHQSAKQGREGERESRKRRMGDERCCRSFTQCYALTQYRLACVHLPHLLT